jgi:hypothetical protein
MQDLGPQGLKPRHSKTWKSRSSPASRNLKHLHGDAVAVALVIHHMGVTPESINQG